MGCCCMASHQRTTNGSGPRATDCLGGLEKIAGRREVGLEAGGRDNSCSGEPYCKAKHVGRGSL
jgi:hypothetical protein